MRIFSGNSEGVRWEDFLKFDELRRFDSIPKANDCSLLQFTRATSLLNSYVVAGCSVCVRCFSVLQKQFVGVADQCHP